MTEMRGQEGKGAIKLRFLLLAGLLIREAFSFWTGHPFDFEIWVRAGYWVARGYNPYSSLPPAPGLSFANDFGGPGSTFAAAIGYLPFWPILLAGLYDLYALIGSPSPFVYYFLLKQPAIICDVLVAYFLCRYVEARGSDRSSFVLKAWLFSPYTILVSAIWGMFDSVAILFVVFALTARPGAYRGLWAGVATFAKSIPVIYAIPLSRGPRPLRNLALALGIPIAASLMIVWIMGWPLSIVGSSVASTVAKSGSSLSLWETLYYLNTLGTISNSALSLFSFAGYVWIPAVAVAIVLAYRWFGFDTERGLIRSLLLITLTFLLLREAVNEQYALYLVALALIDVGMWSPQRRSLAIGMMAVVLMFNATNDLLFIRYASPLFHQALTVETNLIAKVSALRSDLLLLEAVAFWVINIYYFISLSKERHSWTDDTLQRP
jgi:hypothetical protein